MPAPDHSFDYAVVRVVPRVEREEFINAGVILHCRTLDFLAAAIELDGDRLSALDPRADRQAIERALALVPLICAGHPSGGPIASLPAPDRFHWLVAPRSTITQTSPVHSGLTCDPAATLDRLMATMVRLTGG